MKTPIGYGAILRCDIVTVVDTEADLTFKDRCDERFYTGSISSLVRIQARNAGWARVKTKLIKWPGLPPQADHKKVDVCPRHAALVMTPEELKAIRQAAKEKAKAERETRRAAQPKSPRGSRQPAEPNST
jgi:hypothetical protein